MIWNKFFWRFEKHIALSEKKQPLGQLILKGILGVFISTKTTTEAKKRFSFLLFFWLIFENFFWRLVLKLVHHKLYFILFSTSEIFFDRMCLHCQELAMSASKTSIKIKKVFLSYTYMYFAWGKKIPKVVPVHIRN